MKSKENNEVNASVTNSNTMDYESKPLSVKLTPTVDKMLTYISETTQITRSNAVRYSITELYRKLKEQNSGDNHA